MVCKVGITSPYGVRRWHNQLTGCEELAEPALMVRRVGRISSHGMRSQQCSHRHLPSEGLTNQCVHEGPTALLPTAPPGIWSASAQEPLSCCTLRWSCPQPCTETALEAAEQRFVGQSWTAPAGVGRWSSREALLPCGCSPASGSLTGSALQHTSCKLTCWVAKVKSHDGGISGRQSFRPSPNHHMF